VAFFFLMSDAIQGNTYANSTHSAKHNCDSNR
jgi:hypothetical protein